MIDARRRGAVAACLGCSAAALAGAAPVRAQEVRASIDTSANVGYSSNPFHLDGGNTGSGFVEARLLPNVMLLMPTSSLAITGQVRLRHFLRHGAKLDDTYNLAADYQRRINAHDTISAGVGFVDASNTVEDFISDTGVGPPTTGTDLVLVGRRSRRYNAHADVSLLVSPRITVDFGGGANLARYKTTLATNYDSYTGSASVMRQMSEHVRLGVFGSASRTTYSGLFLPNATVISGGITGSFQPTARWDISGRIGVSRVHRSGAFGNSSSLTGNVSVCRTGERDSLCGTAARQYLPTGLLGTRPQTTLAVNYSRKLSERDSVALGAGYTQGASATNGLFARKFVYVNASYQRRLSERLRASVAPFYRQIYEQGPNRKADYGGRISLSYRFGDVQ